jgi:hypothetical protein
MNQKSIYTNKEAFLVNKLAREQLKLKILNDVTIDLAICDIEGWDKKEYILELQELLASLLKDK